MNIIKFWKLRHRIQSSMPYSFKDIVMMNYQFSIDINELHILFYNLNLLKLNEWCSYKLFVFLISFSDQTLKLSSLLFCNY